MNFKLPGTKKFSVFGVQGSGRKLFEKMNVENRKKNQVSNNVDRHQEEDWIPASAGMTESGQQLNNSWTHCTSVLSQKKVALNVISTPAKAGVYPVRGSRDDTY